MEHPFSAAIRKQHHAELLLLDNRYHSEYERVALATNALPTNLGNGR